MDKCLETPVFLTFFVKYNTLEKVFSMIQEVKPRMLFLASDGPREGCVDDVSNVNRCREIVENIDWECEVYKYYQTTNRGIVVNLNYGLTNAFKITHRLIFLEDDKLPTKSFFYFCEQMLERYKDDQRILRVCGGNHCGIYEKCEADYFFARYQYSGAMGMWRRSYEELDRGFAFLEDKYTRKCLEGNLPKEWKHLIKKAAIARKDFLEDGLPKSDELMAELELYLQNRCNIYPKRNMIIDIGCAEGSEHCPDDIRKVPKALQQSIMGISYEIEGELKHPSYIVPDIEFEKELLKRTGTGSGLRQLLIKIETFFRYWRYGNFNEAIAKLKKYISRKFSNRTDKNGL
ncbi:MAG: hypothetical protein NC489_41740 [Ruminococcus flavefaciens]|nr:hypothetical protein [Ruminococcus flavefaciens]